MSSRTEPVPQRERQRSQGGYAVRSAGRAIASGLRNGIRLLAQGWRRLLASISPVTSVVAATGWLVLIGAVVSFVLALALGWAEFAFIGATLAAALLVALAFIFGRATFAVLVELTPARVVAGERALGRMLVRNTGGKPSVPVTMELPVGAGRAEFALPAIPAAGDQEELFAVPTARRAVVIAGPAVSVRGDQLGMFRRTVRWTDPVELFVHPVTVRLGSSAAGLVRDLEGEVTKTVTDNDISFHALRAYQPGDALRNVHWRTTARTGQLMVRQFEETRRTHLTLVLSTEQAHYASDDEFELAISIAASIGLQVIRDATSLSVVTEAGTLRTATPVAFLDDTSRIQTVDGANDSVRDFTRNATMRLPAPSVAILVAGSRLPLADFRSVETLFGPDTTTIGFRASTDESSRLAKVSGLTVMTIGGLADLPKLLRRVGL